MSRFLQNVDGALIILSLPALWSLFHFGRYMDALLSPISLSLVAPFAGGIVFVSIGIWRFTRSQMKSQSEDLARGLQYGHFDFLTKLPNRVLLQDRFKMHSAAAKRDGQQIALHLVDLDNFKQINDLHGHLAGDHILVLAANRLLETCREIDTVARLGGDEFVILQMIDNTNEAKSLGERIVRAMSLPFKFPGGEVTIGCSIGVVNSTGSSPEMERLVDEADGALYLSKKAGGNVVNFATSHCNEPEPKTGLTLATETKVAKIARA